MPSSPNLHALIVAVVAVVMLGAWMSGRTPPDQQANAAAVVEADQADAIVPPPLPPAPPAPQRTLVVVAVKPGDSAARIFKRHGLNAHDLQLLTSSGTHGERLKSIFPGHELAFEQDDAGNLLYLRYSPGRLETVEFKRVGDHFEGTKAIIEPEQVLAYRHAVIDSSLFIACQGLKLPDEFAVRLTGIFQWDIDFIHDIRAGDGFHVLYNERYVDGQRLEDLGHILAAEVVVQGRSYRAVRYEDQAGNVGYYTPEGRNMRKAFLRAPLDYSRISSSFNLNRVHPLWKSAMPHRGIDYAAPTGTRVKAAADGTVVTAGHTRANGNYIVLRHGGSHRTKYLHLSRFASGIQSGRRVMQSDTIGFVGATGWATGPHLHYEFLVDGVHQNPRTVPLPDGTPIGAGERGTFELASRPLLTALEDRKARASLAYAAAPQTDAPQ